MNVASRPRAVPTAPVRRRASWGRSLNTREEAANSKAILNRRAQLGRHPPHRIGLGDDLVDVIAIEAPKRVHLEADPRRLDACQDHRTQAFGAEVGLNCNAAWIKQDF